MYFMKKTIDDYRFELNLYLRKAGLDDPSDFIEKYEKILKLSETHRNIKSTR